MTMAPSLGPAQALPRPARSPANPSAASARPAYRPARPSALFARLSAILAAALAALDPALAPPRGGDQATEPPSGGGRAGWLRGATIAHRGLHDAGAGGPIENSRAAFIAAIAAGLGIECDVQQTADMQAAVFHDFTLDRLTAATGPVIAHTADELAQIPLADGAGETIPLLPDVLALIAGRVPLLIEIKLHPDQPHAPLCQAVATALARNQGALARNQDALARNQGALGTYPGPHAVMSFDPRVPAWFAAHAPHIPRGLVMSNADTPGLAGLIRRHRAIRRAKPDVLALDIRDLPDPISAAARRRGLPVATWTVRTPALLARARAHADAAIAEGAGLPTPAPRPMTASSPAR